ncbi:hypothetical protein FOFC_02822 [Fusarium oxysporum]|nr:hypothetical protein FOFC_02822 [Fusarium oxysporum]
MNFYGDLDASMSLADVRARRMRCYGHILNLVARAFLYARIRRPSRLNRKYFDLLGRWEDDLRHWRKKGPVGKLHNIVKFIRSSPQSFSKGLQARTTNHKNISWQVSQRRGSRS